MKYNNILREDIISKFRSTLLGEGVNLPRGTKKAKIVTHVDLDGVISGITLVKHLEKQGIPKERITVELAQYGDDKKEGINSYTNKFIGKKNEFVGVSDYSKLPKVKPYSIFNRLLSFEAKSYKKQIVDFMNKNNFETMSVKDFKDILYSNFKNIKKSPFTDKTINELFLALKGYSKVSKIKDKDFEKANMDNIEGLEFQTVMPDFVADHHSNENHSLSGGLTGGIEAESPSEAEDLAKRYIHGLWSKKDIEAVSMVDSAGYNVEQLENTVFLNKHFKGNDKEKNLATILSCLYDNLAKKDREAARWVIKNADTNLASVYSATLKAIKYNNERLEYLNKLKNGDVEGAKEILKDIPNVLSQQYERRGEPTRKAMGYEDWRTKNSKDLKDALTGYKSRKDEEHLENIKGKRGEEFKQDREYIKGKKGKIAQSNNFTLFNGKSMKTQYSRYMTSLYSVNGKRTPFSLRYWNGMFQVSKNTLYDGHVNFQNVQEYVLKDVANFLLSKGLTKFKVDNIIEDMKKDNGGHSTGIWTFSGFDKIKPTSKEYGDYWEKKNMVDRATKLNKNPSELVPNAAKRKDELEKGVIEKYKRISNEAFELAIRSAIKWTNKLYPVDASKTKRLNTTNKAFEGPEDKKWD